MTPETHEQISQYLSPLGLFLGVSVVLSPALASLSLSYASPWAAAADLGPIVNQAITEISVS